jgi:hypothetical protein
MLNLRRGILWVVSLATGAIATVATLAIFQTTLDKFSVSNALLIFASFGSLAFIWGDWVLRTNYLKK